MSFATTAELKAFIGVTAAVSGIADADLTILLTSSYNEICARLTAEDVDIPASSTELKSAELSLTLHKVQIRGKIDGTITDAEGSAGNYAVFDVDSSSYVLYLDAWRTIDAYIKAAHRTAKSSNPRVYRVN